MRRSRFVSALFVITLALSLGQPAGAAPGDITLVGQLVLPTTNICDVWGYEADGSQYAIVGDWTAGVYIIDVTTPAAPQLIETVTGVYGFDVKVYDHYIYSCGGGSTFRETNVIDIVDPYNAVVGSNPFTDYHNLTTIPEGFLFGEYPGLKAYDLSNPTNPALVWNETSTSDGHDCSVVGDRLYDFRGYGETNIWDISPLLNSTGNPTLLGTIPVGTSGIDYNHSGYPSEDGNYLFICDELADPGQADITVWDISNPAAAVQVGGFMDNTNAVHNMYIIGNTAYVSFYTAGFRTFDVSDPTTPVLKDTYDTSTATYIFDGNFGVYPFASTGLVYCSDWDNGLFVFSVEEIPVATSTDGATPKVAATLAQNYPNPFNPTTTIEFNLPQAHNVELAIYDPAGKRVRTLVNEFTAAGNHTATWNGFDNNGSRVASGVYFYRLTAGKTTISKQMVMLK